MRWFIRIRTGLFRFSHFCAPQINAAVRCDLTRRGGEAPSGPLQPIEHRRWSPDMSAPQHIGVRPGTDSSAIWRSGADVSAPQQIVVGEPTGRLSGVREQTCRLPSKLSLGSRQVGSPEHCRWGPDMSAP